MSITINVPYGDKIRSFRVKDYDEITLADWRALTAIDMPDTTTGQYRLLSTYTGIPVNKLRHVRAGDMDEMITVIGQALSLAQNVRNEDVGELPKSIQHEGIEYVVPQDMEKHTRYGQWCDLGIIDKIEHEADILIHTLNVLLLPRGEQYGAVDRKEAWARFPMRRAHILGSHFFDNSARYKRETRRCTEVFLTFAMHRIGRGLTASLSAMARPSGSTGRAI